MSIKTIIDQLRWWSFNCDRTNAGCCARTTLREAADMLEMFKTRLENEAARDVCRYCGAEDCVGRSNCPAIAEKVRRVIIGEE